MNKVCTITNREETVVAYLYDDLAPGERLAFDAHLAQCFVCQTELSELGSVRGQLQEWSPPEPARALTSAIAQAPAVAAPARRWSPWTDMPVWARAAAAVLVVGVAAGAANLQVKVAADGMTVNTGWLKPAASAAPAGATSLGAAVSREDLAALEAALRQNISAQADANAALVIRRGDEVLNKTRAMLAASEQNQGRELAIGVGKVWTDVLALRERDNRIINAALQLQDSRTADIAYKTINSYAQSVSMQK